MDGGGAGTNVPHSGEQFEFAMDKTQVTPLSAPGPVTTALIVIGPDPTPTNANVLLKFTTTGAPADPDPEDPQETQAKPVTKIKTANANRFMATFAIEEGRSSTGFENPNTMQSTIGQLCEYTDTTPQMLRNNYSLGKAFANTVQLLSFVGGIPLPATVLG